MQHDLSKRTLEAIRKAGPRGRTERELRKCCRPFAAASSEKQRAVLCALAAAGTIRQVTSRGFSNRGVSRVAWVSGKPETANE